MPGRQAPDEFAGQFRLFSITKEPIMESDQQRIPWNTACLAEIRIKGAAHGLMQIRAVAREARW
jgi:hypothetical protein